ncbi:hypothetical protein PLESTB_001810500 [Pleodorina starrii]|uniref:BTB domain-containing protein n=1 Tax=Pleodorina starrii TaxID=330485 RepID=A0A9W6C1N5_9CHLO|nr:hypothetical protein PLESTM_000906800 [Pleodorina starrii]GLC61852.1 hypothetical protein PLESTB_001810500 [Pleodorina starrii]GLC76912.1 hypothetical protein PLESTF_001854800 [Pleodorina starrii]
MSGSDDAQNKSTAKPTSACGADGDPVGAAAPTHGPGCALRLVCRDGILSANTCVLRRASSVLRQTLGLALPVPGELSLCTDSVAAWGVVLELLKLETYPLQLVTMDNVAALLVLADKYDIPVVRGACAHFLHIHAPQLRIDAPLSSAANVVTAASLVVQYCSTHPALQQYCTTVRQRLDAELAVLRRPPPPAAAAGAGAGADERGFPAVLRWHLEVLHLVGDLEAIVRTEEYVHSVAAEVQIAVSGAMLTGLRHLASRPPPPCQLCNLPVSYAADDAVHGDCAERHYTALHTKDCRICGVAMAPSHARFCNSCAYRRKK